MGLQVASWLLQEDAAALMADDGTMLCWGETFGGKWEAECDEVIGGESGNFTTRDSVVSWAEAFAISRGWEIRPVSF